MILRVSADEEVTKQRSKEVKSAERANEILGMRGYLGVSILDMNINGEELQSASWRSDRGFSRVTGASEDGEARIFWERWIGLGELAEEELGALARFNKPGMETIGTKAETRGGVRR